MKYDKYIILRLDRLSHFYIGIRRVYSALLLYFSEGNLLEGFESPEGSVDGVSTPGELHATMSRHYNGGRQSNAYTSKSAPCGKKDIDNTNHTKSAPLTGTDVLLFTKGIEKSQNRKSIKPPVPLPPPVIVVEKDEEIIRDQPVVASIPAAPTLPHSDQAVKLLSKKSSEASYSSARSQCSSSSKHIYETIAEQDCNGTGSSVSLACLPGESEHSDRDISPSPRPSFSLPEYTTTAMDPPRIPRNDNPNAELPYNNWLHGTVERELPHDTAEGACSTAKLTAKKTTPPANLKVESPRKKSFLAKLGFRRDKKKHADSSKPHSDSSSNVLKTEPPYDRAKSISSPDFSLPEELFFPLDTSKNSSICNV